MKEVNKTCRAKKVNVSLTASVKRKFHTWEDNYQVIFLK